jgi:hypothetical protein
MRKRRGGEGEEGGADIEESESKNENQNCFQMSKNLSDGSKKGG